MRNSSESGVIIFDEFSMIRNRMCNLLTGFHIHVYEASNFIEVLNLLSEEDINIDLIIMDLGNDVNKGFEVLTKIKEKKSTIPVFLLTSNNKRLTFIRGIAEGASDYILKPFDDSYLLEKVLQILKKNNKEMTLQDDLNKEIVFDIQSYLTTEFRKAEKGKYAITVLMCTFFIPVNEFNTEIENKYIQVSELFYQSFKSILWDIDIFERYGSQTFIGIFPYCGIDNIEKIQNKLKDRFDMIKKEKEELSSFQLAISSSTYPSEIEDPKELLLSLGLRLKDEIDRIKKI